MPDVSPESASPVSPATGNTPVPLLDVNRGNAPFVPAILEKIEAIVRSGQFIGGPHCAELESAIATFCQTHYAIGCALGSDALLLSLMAIGLEPGDEVIVPSFTFFASVSAIMRLGGVPVFVDIDPRTFNMNPAHAAELVTPRTRAIMPVHLFGQCCDMDAIGKIAGRHELHIIEDAAQSIGASWKGCMAGSMGTTGCISFYPTKNLGAFGDAGMVVCNDPEIASRVRLFANHGMQPRYYHQVVGINSRLDAIQAAILATRLPGLRMSAAGRQRNARLYDQLFTAAGLREAVCLPASDPRCDHVWNQYTIRIPGGRRDEIRAALAVQGVGSEVYYPVPMHRQECFAWLNCPAGSLPETERAASEVLSLPIFPELNRAEIQRVVATLAHVISGQHTVRHAA